MNRTVLRAMLFLTQVGHHLFVLGNIASFFLLPMKTPFYVWIPLLTFLINLFFSPIFRQCPVTSLENRLRTTLNKPTIGGFVKHYYIKNFLRIKKACVVKKKKSAR